MYNLKVVLPALGVLSMATIGTAHADTCKFSAATQCDGGGTTDICTVSGGGLVCNVEANAGSGSATLSAISVFSSPDSPFPPGSHHWHIWGVDTAGNNYCCVVNPNPTLTVLGSPQDDVLKLAVLDGVGTHWTIRTNPPSTSLNTYVYGDDGDDDILGSLDNNVLDELHGENGEDYVWGLSGNDVLYGEDGDDQICGGPGNDILDGGAEDDELRGEGGLDSLNGGTEVSADTCSNDDGGPPDTECETTTGSALTGCPSSPPLPL